MFQGLSPYYNLQIATSEKVCPVVRQKMHSYKSNKISKLKEIIKFTWYNEFLSDLRKFEDDRAEIFAAISYSYAHSSPLKVHC